MKANDLMIGDWVYFYGEYPFAVSALYHNAHHPETIMVTGSEDGHIRAQDVVEDLKPIPLTEEILKANGFELTTKDKNTGYINVSLHPFHMGFWPDKNHASWNSCDVSFVHLLQHALRLCGLNDLVDNFKITL